MTDEVFIREPGVEGCEHLEVCEHACRMWCRSYKPRVDRDALLALADEIDDVRGDGIPYGDYELYRWQRIIREALGVER